MGLTFLPYVMLFLLAKYEMHQIALHRWPINTPIVAPFFNQNGHVLDANFYKDSIILTLKLANGQTVQLYSGEVFRREWAPRDPLVDDGQ